MIECKHCGYSWEPRVRDPKYCPRCKQNLSRRTETMAASLIRNFLDTLADEGGGFAFGLPWRFTEKSLLAVLPITRKHADERPYVTLERAERNGWVKMIDTGDIGRVGVKNVGKSPVYVRMGQIFKGGGSQPRAAIHSVIIMPGRSMDIDVKCVSASTPIRGGVDFEAGGVVPAETEGVLAASMAEPELSMDLQRDVWASAARFGQRSVEFLTSVSPRAAPSMRGRFTDNLAESTKAFKELISDILNKVPAFEDQVGMAILDVRGCRGLELFDVPASWEELREDIIAKHGEAIQEPEESVFQYIPEKAKALVQDVIRQDFSHRLVWEQASARTYAVFNTRMVGEATEIDGEVIHLVINRRELWDDWQVPPPPFYEDINYARRGQPRLRRRPNIRL